MHLACMVCIVTVELTDHRTETLSRVCGSKNRQIIIGVSVNPETGRDATQSPLLCGVCVYMYIISGWILCRPQNEYRRRWNAFSFLPVCWVFEITTNPPSFRNWLCITANSRWKSFLRCKSILLLLMASRLSSYWKWQRESCKISDSHIRERFFQYK